MYDRQMEHTSICVYVCEGEGTDFWLDSLKNAEK